MILNLFAKSLDKKCCIYSSKILLSNAANYQSKYIQTQTSLQSNRLDELKSQLPEIPSLKSFLESSKLNYGLDNTLIATRKQSIPYIDPKLLDGQSQKVFIETYGCQMNVNDTQIVSKILTNHNYLIVHDGNQADIVFLMTCSIREGAEQKIFNKLQHLQKRKQKGLLQQIGLIGCMASRLKFRLLEREKLVDLVVGPDSYRQLPNLLALSRITGHNAINVLLSMDETYSDILPTITVDAKHQSALDSEQNENKNVQLNDWSSLNGSKAKKTFVSITRGCDNMCSYCVVPYTRGRERSRTVDSILKEVSLLSEAGVKEVTLLGQNVNSYRDYDPQSIDKYGSSESRLASGFSTIYKKDKLGGITFDILLDKVAQVNPEMRIRFISPHPKDFTDEVIEVMARYPNICKNIHLPAQSGDNKVLELMRRGYTKESYLNLVDRIKNRIPNITFTSDFICGFHGETEEAFEHSLDLVRQVNYSFVFSFPYSVREKTFAHKHYPDEVSLDVKKERSVKLLHLFRDNFLKFNQNLIGKNQLILIENESRKSSDQFYGRNDFNTKVIIDKQELHDVTKEPMSILNNMDAITSCSKRQVQVGDYVYVKIKDATSQTLFADPIAICLLQQHSYVERHPLDEIDSKIKVEND